MSFKEFHELDVWRVAKELAVLTYKVTDFFPPKEMYGLTSQMRRSAVSIPSNIAEGIGRASVNDIIHFLIIARGSLYELDTQIRIAHEIGLLGKDELRTISDKLLNTKSLLNAFIGYQNTKK